MHKLILIPVIVLGFIFTEDIFRQMIYKPVGEKGTINLSDSPAPPVITTRRGAAERDRAEVLKRDEMTNRSGQEIYKTVDEKGTINFSDSPTSPVITTRRGAAEQDGAEVLMRNEMANRSGQEIYRSVDEKGTINSSDTLTSPVTTKRGASKQDGAEVKMANRRPLTDSEIKAALVAMPTWRGEGLSSGGSSRTVRS